MEGNSTSKNGTEDDEEFFFLAWQNMSLEQGFSKGLGRLEGKERNPWMDPDIFFALFDACIRIPKVTHEYIPIKITPLPLPQLFSFK